MESAVVFHTSLAEQRSFCWFCCFVRTHFWNFLAACYIGMSQRGCARKLQELSKELRMELLKHRWQHSRAGNDVFFRFDGMTQGRLWWQSPDYSWQFCGRWSLSLSLCPCSDIWFGSISFADILVDSQMDLPLLYIGAASIRRLQYGSKPLKDNDLPIFEWGNNLRMNIHLPTILILNAGDHGSCWHFPHWTDPCPAEVHGADLDLRT